MIKVFFDFLQFLLTCAPLLTSLAVFTLLSILLAKSIKKHSNAFYIILAIPFFLVAIPTILRWCGVEVTGFVGVPVLGQILRDYIHMGTLGHPLLIIIMYMGALDPRKSYVKKLMSIRKELSIIVGFPVLTHSLIRVANNFMPALRYFTDNEAYQAANPHIVNEFGAFFSSFSLVLGIVMLLLFLPLWITSFDSVRLKMNAVKWKKLQKWSYVLYATLFIHAIGITLGGMLNPRERGVQQQQPAVEVTAQVATETSQGERTGRPPREERPERGERGERTERPTQGKERSERVEQPTSEKSQNAQVDRPQRRQAKGFSDIDVPRKTRQQIHLISLVLIYGSYLYLRVRKHNKQKQKRKVTSVA